MIYLTKAFWIATFERAIKTLAQSAISAIGASAVVLQDVNWVFVASGVGLATVLSVLFSIASASLGANAGPSLASEELVTAPF